MPTTLLPAHLIQSVAEEIKELRKDVQQWIGLRNEFAIALQDWDDTVLEEITDSSSKLFPAKANSYAEIAADSRETIFCKGNSTISRMSLLLERIEQRILEMKQTFGLLYLIFS